MTLSFRDASSHWLTMLFEQVSERFVSEFLKVHASSLRNRDDGLPGLFIELDAFAGIREASGGSVVLFHPEP
jgi:hypothetical protein